MFSIEEIDCWIQISEFICANINHLFPCAGKQRKPGPAFVGHRQSATQSSRLIHEFKPLRSHNRSSGRLALSRRLRWRRKADGHEGTGKGGQCGNQTQNKKS
jgi:hypothetical protein